MPNTDLITGRASPGTGIAWDFCLICHAEVAITTDGNGRLVEWEPRRWTPHRCGDSNKGTPMADHRTRTPSTHVGQEATR